MSSSARKGLAHALSLQTASLTTGDDKKLQQAVQAEMHGLRRAVDLADVGNDSRWNLQTHDDRHMGLSRRVEDASEGDPQSRPSPRPAATRKATPPAGGSHTEPGGTSKQDENARTRSRGDLSHSDSGQRGESHRQPPSAAPIPEKMKHEQKTRQRSPEPLGSREETPSPAHDRSSDDQSHPPSPRSEKGVRTAEDPVPSEEEQDWNWKTVNDPAAPSQWSTYWEKRTAVCKETFGKLDPKILKRADVIRTKRSQKIRPSETAEALSRFQALTRYLPTVLSDDMKCDQRAIQTLALWCPSVDQWNTTSRTILEAESGQADKVKPAPDPRTMPGEANHRKKEEASKLDTKVGIKSPTRTGRGGEDSMDGYSPVNKTHGSEADVKSGVSGDKGRNADRSPRDRVRSE